MKIVAPPSKSYAIRAIVGAMLAGGGRVEGAGSSDDVRAALGAAAAWRAGGRVVEVGESALLARLVACVAAAAGRSVTIEGRGSLLERPLFLEVLGVGDFLPVEIVGRLSAGGFTVDGSTGSQVVSGLLMGLPLLEGDSILRVVNPVSVPYIEMTLDVLACFGVEVERRSDSVFFVRGGQRYEPCDYVVEGDWSGASCLLAAGAIAGRVSVGGLRMDSGQADRAVLDALRAAGARVVIAGDCVVVERPGDGLRAFVFDAGQCPDLFPALVALAAACRGRSVIAGVGRLRHKESDRAAALCEEYGRLGVSVVLEGDSMCVRGGDIVGGLVSAHGDHRIAMSLAASGLRAVSGEVSIDDPGCVAKSYPGFFDALGAVCVW